MSLTNQFLGVFMQCIRKYFVVFLALNIALTSATIKLHAEKETANASTTAKPNIYQKLMDLHLPALAHKAADEKAISEKLEKENKEKAQSVFKLSQIQIPQLQEVEKLAIAYRVLASQKNAATSSNILSLNTVNDLEMLCGYTGKIDNFVFNNLNQTQTTFGKIELQKMLMMPDDNIEELQLRQEIIKTLINDEELLNSVTSELEKIKASEHELLWFWQSSEATLENLINMIAFPNASGLSALNKSPVALEINRAFISVIMPGLTGLVSISMAYLLHRQYPIKAALIASCYGFFTYLIVSIAVSKNNISNTAHGKMNHIARLVDSIRQLGSIINTHQSFKSVFPEYKNLVQVISPEAREANNLLNRLSAGTFKSDPSFFRYQGRVISAFKIMQQVKDDFVDALRDIGRLDAYVSIAQLYKQYDNNKKTRYCFVDFVEQEKPYLSIKNFWHPSINSDKVVVNSIELGNNQSPRSAIVTGPNAGGKSTSLKAITIAVMLAQSFGIAPAQEMKMKPFSKINTYMNITDSTGHASLFQAEMLRIKDLIDSMKALPQDKSAFIVMDEIFTGTNPKEGEAGAYGVAEKFINLSNCMCIFATHFERLTQLEAKTSGLAMNKKVSVIKNANGSYTFPYKLEDGISHQAIALDLLALEGFDTDILQSAYGVINNTK